MCARTARWSTIHYDWLTYCGGHTCTNRRRLCQCCGAEFERGVDGAGNKYCSSPCKQQGYHPTTPRAVSCAWCDRQSPATNYRGGLWPYICKSCLEPIRRVVHRLKEHRVPHNLAKELVNDPHCRICGKDIVTPTLQRGGRRRPLLVVDHDHDCCHGEKSCGQCVRGFLCGACNSGIGLLRDDSTVVRAAVSYLESSTGK